MKVVKRYKLAIRRLISTRDIIYNMMTTVNNAICYIGTLRE